MRALIASLTLSLLVLAGCGDDDAPVAAGGGETSTTTTIDATTDPEQARLDDARRRWAAAGIDDYRLTWAVQCFCPRTAFVDTVVDGEVVTHEQEPDSDALDDPGPKTVPDIFDEVQAAIDEDPATLEVTYDEETGAVTRWWADYRLDMADEEQGLEVVIEPLVDGEVPASPDFDPDALAVDHPCGRGFQVGSRDQQVALVFWPSGDGPPAAGVHVLPGGSWTGTVRLGQDLFANWCDDVLEPGEPTPEVREEWPVVEGSIEVVLPPDGAWGPATLTATGLVAERPDGERAVIGDITIENSNHGLIPG